MTFHENDCLVTARTVSSRSNIVCLKSNKLINLITTLLRVQNAHVANIAYFVIEVNTAWNGGRFWSSWI